MTSDFLTGFLAAILQEHGVENHLLVAQKAAADLRKARVVNQRHLDTIAMHRQVDQLRAQGVPSAVIAERLNLTRQGVSYIVRLQLMARKTG